MEVYFQQQPRGTWTSEWGNLGKTTAYALDDAARLWYWWSADPPILYDVSGRFGSEGVVDMLITGRYSSQQTLCLMFSEDNAIKCLGTSVDGMNGFTSNTGPGTPYVGETMPTLQFPAMSGTSGGCSWCKVRFVFSHIKFFFCKFFFAGGFCLHEHYD